MTIHNTSAAALSTPADHFAVVGGRVHAFADEDACWRFVHGQRMAYESDPATFLDARYANRRELAA